MSAFITCKRRGTRPLRSNANLTESLACGDSIENRRNHMRFGLAGLSNVAAITAVALASATLASGQAATATEAKTTKTWTPSRTPDGQPDLQGRYTRNGVGAAGTGRG